MTTVTLHIDAAQAIKQLTELREALEQVIVSSETAAQRYDELAHRLITGLQQKDTHSCQH